MASTVYGDLGTSQVQYGLESAQKWLEDNASGYTGAYPDYTSRTSPVDMAYGVDYVQNANPYQTVSGIATNWGDFQNQMRQPVYEAYNQNLRDIDSRFSNSGLYGSIGYGLNDDVLTKAGNSLMTGLLSADTAAQDQYLKNAEFVADQNLNAWKTGLTEAERQNAYNTDKFNYDYTQAQNAVDFANSEAARQDAYNSDLFNYNYNQYRQPFSDYLSLASGSASTANQSAANQTAQSIADSQADAASSAVWGQALGGLAGGLLSKNSAASSLWDGSGFELFSPSTWL